jgi:hypothetical protein
VAQYLVADFSIGSNIVFGCQFFNRQHHSFWLPISESTMAQFLVPIFESAVTKSVAVDF